MSVRGFRVSRPTRIGWALIALVIASVVIAGWRGLLPAFPRGDLLYHWGLTHGILRGEIPPGGPYQGLPAYYPPGFHLLLAAATAITSLSLPTVTLLLGFAWLPVLPLSTFALARRVSGRADIALLAAALTVFGGAFDWSPDRLWVNSLFLVGHEAYPLYPRDLVFGLLPLAVLAFLRALEGSRGGWPWAVVAGGLFGACAIIQVQLLLPIPISLVIAALAAASLDRTKRRVAALAVVVTGGLTAVVVSPWLLPTIALIRRNGGVTLDSAETLLPAQFNLWDYPREFGLLLPLAVVGAGVVLIHLRRRAPDLLVLRPRSVAAPLVLVPWFFVPWVLAVLYDPGWPLEDALRPQRLWLLASQPGAILAAIGLFAVVRSVVEIRWRRPRWALPAVIAVFLVMAVPTVLFTVRLLSQTWLEPKYGALQLERDRVPDMAAVLGDSGSRSTVLTYEDWSSLVWYETGSWVVAVNPPGYAKLAFDPQIFTGRSQATRRLDVARAFDGDPADLSAVADAYHADRILVARHDDRWGMIQQVASIAALDPARVDGHLSLVDGNGWDAETLDPQARLVILPAQAGGPIRIQVRFAGDLAGPAVPERRFRLLAVGREGVRDLGEGIVPATTVDDWQVVTEDLVLQPDERLTIQAIDRVTVQSVLGFVVGVAPAGWHGTVVTPDAVVLERNP